MRTLEPVLRQLAPRLITTITALPTQTTITTAQTLYAKAVSPAVLSRGDYGMSGNATRIELGSPPARVLVGPRIGLNLGQGDAFPWRLVDADALAWVSRPLKALRPFVDIDSLRPG